MKSTRAEMNDFVAFYRRQPKISGMPSFSTLCASLPPRTLHLSSPLQPLCRPPRLPTPVCAAADTAINTLSGHYASYGNKYPVPEKRKTRLQQQYKEIERALARGK